MGKGMRPQVGYDNKKYRANYDAIFRRNDAPGVRVHRDEKKECKRKACRGKQG